MQTSATLRNLKCYGLRQQKSTQVKDTQVKERQTEPLPTKAKIIADIA
jgi:hypothetical protein